MGLFSLDNCQPYQDLGFKHIKNDSCPDQIAEAKKPKT
jgi:hypothetical protein